MIILVVEYTHGQTSTEPHINRFQGKVPPTRYYHNKSHTPVCLFVCRSGLRDPVAYSLLGGGVPYPEHRLH